MPTQDDQNNTNQPINNSTNQPVGDTSSVPNFAPIEDLPPMPVDTTTTANSLPTTATEPAPTVSDSTTVVPEPLVSSSTVLSSTVPDLSSTVPDLEPQSPISNPQVTEPTSPFDAVIPPVQDSSNGSAAPSDLPPMTSGPKKKFGTGKIVATILGLFLLVGGVVAGVTLTGQEQNIQEKAVGNNACMCGNSTGDKSPGSCQSDGSCDCPSNFPEKLANKCADIGGGEQEKITSGNCSGSQTKDNGWFQCGNGSGPGSCTFCLYAINRTCNDVLSTKSECNGATYLNCDTNSGATVNPDKNCITSNSGSLIYKYSCPKEFGMSNGCQKNEEHKTSGSYCFDSKFCGTQQIDGPDAKQCFISKEDRSGCSSDNNPTPTPTDSPITAVCQNIKAYSATWALLTNTQLSALSSGTVINFCAHGTSSSGNFDKAKFTINGTQMDPTTTTHAGIDGFCQSYTIPAGTTTFNVTAQVHHVTLGWK